MRFWLLLTLLCSCVSPKAGDDSEALDADGDGHAAPTDCDDADPGVYPGAPEQCDGLDQDCDGVVDEEATDGLSWYADADADGFGDPEVSTLACAQPSGFVPDATDCDDAASQTHPGATEVCDETDNDCDGTVDEEAQDPLTWFADADADGFGDPEASTLACAQPTGFVADDNDCDDGDASKSPLALEICDSIDNDCDTQIDEPDAADAPIWFTDSDGDGFGDPGLSTAACAQPTGFVADANDCDDGDSSVSPAATEICDNIDNDCDSSIDEPDAADAPTWFADSDGDGFGDPTFSTPACTQPAAFVADDTDCDDLDSSVSPNAVESCDSIDNDCDSVIDESDAIDAATWFVDSDGDSFGDPSLSTPACTQPSGFVLDDTDCDDGDISVSPVAVEICDSIDNDCDSNIDEPDAADAATWFADVDGDGFGDPTFSTPACIQPSAFVADDTDCDDSDISVSPIAIELCDSTDNDCDAQIDEPDAADAPIWYADSDGDGFGDPANSTTACVQPSAFVADDSDCDGSDPTVHPGAPEQCGAPDQDCDGRTDDPESTDAGTYFTDADGDGYGDPNAPLYACGPSAGIVADDADCDDAQSTANPAGTEECWNWIDEDCDPNSTGCTPGWSLTDNSLATVYGTTLLGRLGTSMAVGDINGDGFPDLALSSYDGRAYVNFGPLTGDREATASDAVVTLASDLSDLIPMIRIEDVDLSGTGDLILGLPGARRTSGSSGGLGAGAVLLFLDPGPGPLTDADADTIWIGDTAFRGLGRAHGVVDDANGDGVPDLAVLDQGPSPSNNVFLLSGADRGTVDGPSTALATITVDVSGAEFGERFDVAEDLDGDGSRDILVSDSGLGRTSGLSSFWVVPGPAPAGSYPIDSVGFRVEGLYSTSSNTTVAEMTSLHAPGDLNADGYGEVLVAEQNNSYGAVFYILPGPINASTTYANASGIVRPPDYGYIDDVSAGGDLDGDGTPDIAVYSADYAGLGSNNAYIYSGLPEGFVDRTGYISRLVYAHPGAGHGRVTPLETRFDFDADGFDDLVLSHISDRSNVYSGGRVYVIPGTAE